MKLTTEAENQLYDAKSKIRWKLNTLDTLEEKEALEVIAELQDSLTALKDAVQNKPSFYAESGEGFSCDYCDMPPLNEEDALNMEISGICLVCQHEEDAEDFQDWYQEHNSYYMNTRGI